MHLPATQRGHALAFPYYTCGLQNCTMLRRGWGLQGGEDNMAAYALPHRISQAERSGVGEKIAVDSTIPVTNLLLQWSLTGWSLGTQQKADSFKTSLGESSHLRKVRNANGEPAQVVKIILQIPSM